MLNNARCDCERIHIRYAMRQKPYFVFLQLICPSSTTTYTIECAVDSLVGGFFFISLAALLLDKGYMYLHYSAVHKHISGACVACSHRNTCVVNVAGDVGDRRLADAK